MGITLKIRASKPYFKMKPMIRIQIPNKLTKMFGLKPREDKILIK